MNTASCESQITYIDGDAGVLLYRGYPIDQLAERTSFLEVTYLLTHGELPTQPDLDAWTERIERHTHLHDNFKALIGLTIGPGWRRRTMELLGGTRGCTHLVELLGPLGTTAFQATTRAREGRMTHAAGKKPYQLNACHVYKDDSEAVRERWPQFYTGPDRVKAGGTEV